MDVTMTLAEKALADLAEHGVTREIIETIRSLVERGFVEPMISGGDYGFRSTELGLLAVVEVSGRPN